MSSSLTSLIKAAVSERAKSSLKLRLGVPSLEASLRNLSRNGFRPKVVIDIGAYRGEWTMLCKTIWPEASVLMVEASPERMPGLRDVAKSLEDVTATLALLGPTANPSVPFYEQDSASSVLPESAKNGQPFQCLPMQTLDEITLGTVFARPDFLKLDVQGYELAVLEGGHEAFRSCEVALLEVNLLEIYQGAPLLDQTVRFMSENGKRVYDICTLYRRPLDKALWQIDVLFVREESALLASKRYQ